MKPKVSIIIPFYNCPYVNEAITSVLQQSYVHKEIIVVNDGSEVFSDKLHPFLKSIRYIEKPNGGTASALNEGIRHASGDYIAWLSSDDQYLPDKLEQQIAWMEEKNSKFSFTAFYTMNENSEVNHTPIILPFQDKDRLSRLIKRRNLINGSTTIMHKEVIHTIGYFEESYRYTQDYDYWLRVTAQFPIDYLPYPTILYRIHNNMGSIQHSTEQKNELKIIKEKYKN